MDSNHIDNPSSDESNQTGEGDTHGRQHRGSGTKRKRKDAADDDGPDGPGSDRERHQCPHCDRSFGRVEHMKRHAASHSDKRPFKCSHCNKGFHRMDTMQRHEMIHKEPAEPKPKGSRACSACAAAKVRCQGGQPCQRCETRETRCEYPESRHRQDDSPSPTIATLEQNPPPDAPMSGSRSIDLFRHTSLPPPTQLQPTVGVAYSPAPTAWPGIETASPSQSWLPRPPPLPIDLNSPRNVYSQATPASRHLSFGSSVLRPTGLTPLTGLTGSDPYTHARQPAFSVAGSDHQSVNGTATSNWLDTLLAPPSISNKDADTPDTGGSHKTVSMSETYLDGDGARLPKIGIQRRFNLRPSLPIPNAGMAAPVQSSAAYSFPARFCTPDIITSGSDRGIVNEIIYNEIRQSFHDLCGPGSPHRPVFDTPDYPSMDHLQMFTHIYLDEFQPIVPMLHIPTLRQQPVHWLLVLAIAGMGCHLADMPEAGDCSLGLNEHLRRAITAMMERPEHAMDSVVFAQVKLLNCISMTYCGDERLERHGWRQHADVMKFCKTHWLSEDDASILGMNAQGDIDAQWRQWRDLESRRRTGYAIWMVDCMWSYGMQERNLLSLEDAKVPLPCQEVLWDTESALQWQHVMSYTVPMPSLNAATHSIYVEKRVESTMGEFSRILLIHALYSASWTVQTHLSNPMSHWTPRTARQSLATLPHFREPIFLPEDLAYSRWRNATCDCLDILHWRANAVTGAASGIEHPTLLHLHLARIVLLTPFREIANLAFGLTKIHIDPTVNAPSSQQEIAANLSLVRKWAERDQCKARLAMYHAGVLFWHVRLYSAKAFYEPTAVMLAALALWAFGTFTIKATVPHSNSPSDFPATPGPIDAVLGGTSAIHGSSTVDDEASFPTSINIDRPADDEIVQMYIRRGDRMQALIVGVGDIRSSAGPVRVLGEGAKLVSSLANWGSSVRVMRILVELARLSRDAEWHNGLP